jgi:vitamin B12 transporter
LRIAASLLLGGCATLLPAEDGAVPAVATLDQVVVTASRAAESLREVTSNVTVISQEEIKSSTANSLDQLMSQNGFQVINQGAQKIVSIRGMGQPSLGAELQSRVLTLVNGRRVGANNVGLMGIDKDNIERIEIIRGPAAVQYGPSALGGVVNIITKRGTKGFSGALEAGLGSFDLGKESLSLNGSGGGFDGALGLTHFRRNDMAVSGGDVWANTGIDASLSMNADFGYTFAGSHRLGVNYNLYRQDGYKFPDGGWSATGPTGATYNASDLNNRNLAFLYEGGTPGKTFDWSARYSFGRDRNRRDPSRSSWGGTPSTTDLDNKSVAAQIGYTGEYVSLSAGFDRLEYELEDADNAMRSDSTDTGVYFSGKVRILDDKIILSAGGRYDDFSNASAGRERADDNFAPSVGVALLPVKWLKVRANYSEGFRMPAPVEYLGGGGWYVANADLQPEKSKTFEAGVDVNYETFDAGLTWFHSNWDDKIMAKSTGAGWTYQYINLAESTLSGLELAAGYDIGKASGGDFTLRPYVNMTLLTTRDNGDAAQVASVGSDVLPNTPKAALTAGVDFRHTKWDLAINLNTVYFSDILTSDYRPGSPTAGTYIWAGEGAVANLGVEKGVRQWEHHGRLAVRFEVANLLDGANQTYLDYPEAGRSFYGGLRYEF